MSEGDRTVAETKWGDYEIYNPGVAAPLSEVPRVDARRAYEKLMAAKPQRIAMLLRLAALNGADVDNSDAGIQRLNDWFRSGVQEDPADPGWLLPDWYSVVNDAGVFLGDVMIERHPTLRWQFYTWGKTNMYYQKHIIMGEIRSGHPKLGIDVDRVVAAYGHRVIGGMDVDTDAFVRMVRRAGSQV